MENLNKWNLFKNSLQFTHPISAQGLICSRLYLEGGGGEGGGKALDRINLFVHMYLRKGFYIKSLQRFVNLLHVTYKRGVNIVIFFYVTGCTKK